MFDFLIYLAQSALCLAALYLLYKVTMSQETLHRLNRVLLLGSIFVSAMLPLCRVKIVKEYDPAPAVTALEVNDVVVAEVAELGIDYIALLKDLAVVIFFVGVAFMVMRLMVGIYSVVRLIHSGKMSVIAEDVTLTVVSELSSPFSWFGHVVASEKDMQEYRPMILSHELAHIRLCHSWDVLLVDLALCLWWFNPALWLLRRELQSLHEYQADDAVLTEGVDAKTYQLLLIKRAVGSRLHSVANCLNHSNLKKRITMMCRKTSSRWAATKALLVVPMVAVALGAFATTVYVPREVQSKGNEKNEKVQDTTIMIRSVLKISDEKLMLNGEEITEEVLQERLMGLVDEIVLQVDNLTPMGRVADVKEILRANADLKITYESMPKKSDPITVVDGKVVSAEEGLLKLRLTDEKGAPVVGAVVVKAGTNEGICTDPEGRGSLQVKVGDKLVCSMIGKETIHYTVAQLPTEELTLQLKTEVVEIDELVVVGYGAEEQTKAAADEEAVPFMLVDDERKKEIMAQHKRDMEQAKAEMEQAKAAADEEVFLIVESMPKFEGGDINTFRQWVQMRVQYPKELQEAGVSGRVIVQFVVDTDGSVANVQTLRTPDKRLSDQVVELVKKSPKWQPGMQRGVAVKVSMTFPIEFKVSQPEEVAPNGVTPAVAEFAGGDYRRFEQWTQAKVQYPEAAQKEGVKGEVMVTFVVKANGEVGDVDVIGKADKHLAKEALRVVKSSPKWTPALKDGKAVAAKYGIKLRFDDTPFLIVEQMPTFEGGDINTFRRWMEARVKPQKGDDGKPLEGMVIISFVVETDGSVSEFTPMRSPDKRLTEEVERVLKLSPRWEAGQQRGQKVRVKFTLPVQFKAA